MKNLFLFAVALGSFTAAGLAQRRAIDPTNLHARYWALLPVVVNAQGHRVPAHTEGALGLHVLYNSTATLCLAEIVRLNDEDFQPLRAAAARDPRIRIFSKALTRKDVARTVFRAAGFTLEDVEKFFEQNAVRVP
jgi:hypothetical protein